MCSSRKWMRASTFVVAAPCLDPSPAACGLVHGGSIKTNCRNKSTKVSISYDIHMQVTERSKGQPVPKWALKREREHEATNPGPSLRDALTTGRLDESFKEPSESKAAKTDKRHDDHGRHADFTHDNTTDSTADYDATPFLPSKLITVPGGEGGGRMQLWGTYGVQTWMNVLGQLQLHQPQQQLQQQ